MAIMRIFVFLCLSAAHGLASSPSSTGGRLFSHQEMQELLANGAEGRDVATTMQGLEQVWQELPVYVKSKLEEVKGLDLGPTELEEAVQDNLALYQTRLARKLARFHLEVGQTLPEAYQRYVEGDVDCGRMRIQEDPDLHGDWLLTRQEYNTAIVTYQNGIEVHHDRFSRMNSRGIDDVLFTKMAFAYHKMGRFSDAIRNWGYAAELQETRGLLLEAVVSRLRQGYWEEAQDTVPEKLLNKYYPTVSNILKKAQEGTIELLPQEHHRSSDEDYDNKRPFSPSDETETLLQAAFVSHVQGDYVTAHRSFSKVPDTDTEKWGLFSLLLRERQMDGTANCYSKLPADPFSLLKRAVLRRTVKNENEWGGNPAGDALDAVAYGQYGLSPPGNFTDTPEDLISKALEQMDMSSSLRATAYFQIGEYLGPQPWYQVRSAEEEKQRDERLVLQLEYLEKALAEPDISPTVWICATVARLNTGLSIAEHTNHHGQSGATLAARKSDEGPSGLSLSSATLVNGVWIKPYVPRKSTRDEALRHKREETLSGCWERLEDLHLKQSLAALHLARQMNAGATERRLLAELFGKESIAVRNTRQAEYYEDMNEGSGQRAEELMRELLDEAAGPDAGSKSQHMFQLIRALEKQDKYDQALSVYDDYQDTEEYKMDTAPHLLRIAELYQKKGDMEAACQKYRQLVAMDRSSWNIYGFVGLGDIALQGGTLDQALEEFHRGIVLAQADMDLVFSESDKDGDVPYEKSNAISKVTNAWRESGDSLYKHGFYKESLDFFRGCQAASDNPWFDHREVVQKRMAKRIAEVQDQLS